VSCSVSAKFNPLNALLFNLCVAVCCSVLQCVAASCSELQCER